VEKVTLPNQQASYILVVGTQSGIQITLFAIIQLVVDLDVEILVLLVKAVPCPVLTFRVAREFPDILGDFHTPDPKVNQTLVEAFKLLSRFLNRPPETIGDLG
jgi:hypothetical protein